MKNAVANKIVSVFPTTKLTKQSKLEEYVITVPHTKKFNFLFKQILNDCFYLFISSFLFVWKWKTFINHFLTLPVSPPVNFYLKKIGVGESCDQKELLDKSIDFVTRLKWNFSLT